MSKKIWMMIGAVVAAAVVVICVVLVGGKNETYRSIMVYQVNGTATITRARAGEMKAYENLMLQSGDTVAVASESSLRLKLDDDKYVLAEQDTVMSIVAEGNDENARTYIDLQRGAVTSEIQNKLKEGATYEVNTPNSIMAVRGTIFRVDVEMDENNNPSTKLTVFQGTVGVKTIMSDGNVSEEETMVEAGSELMVEGTLPTSEYLGGPENIDYDSLPTIIKDYIEELAQSSVMTDWYEAVNYREADRKAAEEPERPEEPEQQEAERQLAETDAEGQPESTQPHETIQPESSTEPESSSQPKSSTQPESSTEPESSSRPESSSEPESSSRPESSSEPESSTQPESSTEPESSTQPESSTEPESSTQPESSTEPESSSEPESEDGDTKPQYFTVTFQYNGSTFGTQKVKKGEKATEPKLSPTQGGAWDYDFSKKVEKNLIIQWKDK